MSNLALIDDWRRFCKEVEDVPLSTFAAWVQLEQTKAMNERLGLDGDITIGSEDDPGGKDGDGA